MEAFESFVALALEAERLVVSEAIKFPVTRPVAKAARHEIQTHGYEVNLVGARADRLVLATVKSFFGSRGVASEDDSRVDVLFVGWIGLAVLAGELRAGLWVWLGEQSGFGLDEDAAAGQALELGADVLGVLGRDWQVQGHAQVAGPQGTAEVGEGGKDLLVGGVIG